MDIFRIINSHRLHMLAVQVGFVALLVSFNVFANSTEAPRQPATGAGLFIAFAIAYLSRRRAIGGWLLYFYLQLYLGLLISLLFIPQVIANLNPNEWGDSFLYVMFFLSVAPVLLAQLAEAIVATMLLFRRNENNVKIMRNTLYFLVASSAAAVGIDIAYFSEDPAIFFDVITLIFAIIWALYFLKARRVQMVFIDNNWSYTPYSERRALTQQDKKKLRRRAAISAAITFTLFLVLMGSTLQSEGKEPDIGIFAVPLFYGVIAAIIAWYIPIRKKVATDNETNEKHT